MTDELRKEVAKTARLADVYLRTYAVEINNEKCDPKYPSAEFQIGVKPSIKASSAEFFSDNDITYVAIRFETVCEIRGISEPADASEPEITIKADFIAEYEVDKEHAEKVPDWVAPFAEVNAAIHVWPYWREFVQDASSRLRLPASVIIPMYPHKA